MKLIKSVTDSISSIGDASVKISKSLKTLSNIAYFLMFMSGLILFGINEFLIPFVESKRGYRFIYILIAIGFLGFVINRILERISKTSSQSLEHEIKKLELELKLKKKTKK